MGTPLSGDTQYPVAWTPDADSVKARSTLDQASANVASCVISICLHHGVIATAEALLDTLSPERGQQSRRGHEHSSSCSYLNAYRRCTPVCNTYASSADVSNNMPERNVLAKIVAGRIGQGQVRGE